MGSLERLLQDHIAEEILPELWGVNVTQVTDLANLTKEMLLAMDLDARQKVGGLNSIQILTNIHRATLWKPPYQP